MKNVQDSVFGLMEHNINWKKSKTLEMWGRTFDIRIVASDLDEEGILAVQQEAYQTVKDSIPEIIDENFPAIVDFCMDAFELEEKTPEEIATSLEITEILFQRDGSWGVLIDSEDDPDNGLALYFIDGEAQVGEQDEFI